MHYNKKIPLEQERIRLIIKSFEDGEFEYSENFKDHPTVTQNGKGAAIWNNIYTQLMKNFTVEGFRCGKIKRGPWELIYIFDEQSKYLYTFMRGNNFINLHKGDMVDSLYHYSNILCRLNGRLLGTYEPEYEQMSFVKKVCIDDQTDTKLEFLLQEMISSINDDIERYAIVLVDCKKGLVDKIECVIPIAYMSPMYREDWSKYIEAEYNTTEYHVEVTMPDDDQIMLYEDNKDIDLDYQNDEQKQEEENK